MNNGLERIGKEAAMVLFEISWHMHGGIKENLENALVKLKVRK
jgi:hypothetical protein